MPFQKKLGLKPASESKTYTITNDAKPGNGKWEWEVNVAESNGDTQLQKLLRQAIKLVGPKQVHGMVDALVDQPV